jgi:hypothetical protein
MPSSFGQISALTSIVMQGGSLVGTMPSQLTLLSALAGVMVDVNRFTGPLPAWFGEISSLTFLSIGYNLFTGIIPTELAGATAMESMYLYGTPGLTGMHVHVYGVVCYVNSAVVQVRCIIVYDMHVVYVVVCASGSG